MQAQQHPRPMGMVASDNHLWLGTDAEIRQWSNYAALAKHQAVDAVYVPRTRLLTGQIDIHEMIFCRQDLYYVNTKFSCLCVRDWDVSFKPYWVPPFIGTLQPVDKCHLNGLCARDGVPRYVTMLGRSDEPLGWRPTKADGGLLMDIVSNEVLATGLSMPHSPRWHMGKLWVLESGKGTLGYWDESSGQVVTLATLPGFTRGLEMVGPYAFVGLSKVRESTTFSGLPVTRLAKRISGVYVIDLRSGAQMGGIEFTRGVDEVFAVSALPFAQVNWVEEGDPQSKINYIVGPEDATRIKMPETPIEMAAPHFERGNDLFTENKKEEAILAYQKAIEIQPDHLPAVFNMAVAMGDLGRFDEALGVLNQVIEGDASLVEAYDSLGYVYYKQGLWAEAKAQYEKVLSLQPAHVKAQNALALLKREYGI
jgi:uncharacterized protein (TIGR03032 family)